MSLRPSNPRRITFGDLAPGDVLLSCGDSDLDLLITQVDRGDYSHASLVVEAPGGSGGPRVVEATTNGIKCDSIDVDMDAQYLVDAYRYVSPSGFRFGDPGWPSAPVLEQANGFVGGAYAYDRLLMAGVALFAAEASQANPDVEALLRVGGMLLAEGLESWVHGAHGSGKTPMTCVQVLTSAFWQADASPAGRYGLQVQLVRPDVALAARASAPPSPAVEEWRRMRARIKTAIDAALPDGVATHAAMPVRPMAAAGTGLVLTAGSPQCPAAQCTPRDLQTSPTLEFLGCLKDTGMRRIVPGG